LNIKGTIAQISIFEAAMPTFLTAGIITEEYGLNARLVNLVIGISIIVAFATTGIWYLLLKNL
jgi:predicted permease